MKRWEWGVGNGDWGIGSREPTADSRDWRLGTGDRESGMGIGIGVGIGVGNREPSAGSGLSFG